MQHGRNFDSKIKYLFPDQLFTTKKKENRHAHIRNRQNNIDKMPEKETNPTFNRISKRITTRKVV